MTMGVNSLNTSKWSNVDYLAAKQVTDQIFNKAQTGATIDASSIARVATQKVNGVDFYSATTSIEAQRQIAMTNAGMNRVNLVNAQQLSSIAALSSYHTTKSVEGKLHVNANEYKSETLTKAFGQLSLSEVFKSSNDTKGSNSNPFSAKAEAENSENTATSEGLNVLG